MYKDKEEVIALFTTAGFNVWRAVDNQDLFCAEPHSDLDEDHPPYLFDQDGIYVAAYTTARDPESSKFVDPESGKEFYLRREKEVYPIAMFILGLSALSSAQLYSKLLSCSSRIFREE